MIPPLEEEVKEIKPWNFKPLEAKDIELDPKIKQAESL